MKIKSKENTAKTEKIINWNWACSLSKKKLNAIYTIKEEKRKKIYKTKHCKIKQESAVQEKEKRVAVCASGEAVWIVNYAVFYVHYINSFSLYCVCKRMSTTVSSLCCAVCRLCCFSLSSLSLFILSLFILSLFVLSLLFLSLFFLSFFFFYFFFSL